MLRALPWVAAVVLAGAPAAAQSVPDRWRGLSAMPRAGTAERRAIDAAVAAGTLDPRALMQQIAGPLPLPPEARLVGCASSADSLVFSLDRAPSIHYLFRLHAMEEEARRPVHPKDAARRNARPAARTFEQLREVEAGSGRAQAALKMRLRSTIEQAGYVKDAAAWPAIAYRAGTPAAQRTVDARVAMQSWTEQQLCARKGVAEEAGPVIRLTYATAGAVSPLDAMLKMADRLNAEWQQAERDADAAARVR